jgi:beta-xylosidase
LPYRFIGTPFNTTFSSTTSYDLRIRAHDGTILFHTQFCQATWHNFAVVVDWDKLTLKVFYSTDALPLKAVTTAQDNSSNARGPNGQGDFHFGVLKVRLETCKSVKSAYSQFVTRHAK